MIFKIYLFIYSREIQCQRWRNVASRSGIWFNDERYVVLLNIIIIINISSGMILAVTVVRSSHALFYNVTASRIIIYDFQAWFQWLHDQKHTSSQLFDCAYKIQYGVLIYYLGFFTDSQVVDIESMLGQAGVDELITYQAGITHQPGINIQELRMLISWI